MSRWRGVSILVTALSLLRAAAAQDSIDNSVPAPTFGTTVVLPAGLHGTIYFIPKKTTVLPDFHDGTLERIGELWTNTLNIPPRHWRAGFPGLTERFEWFAIDYTGRFWITAPGRYIFALISDDGSRLFLDNTPIIDNDCEHPPDIRIAAVNLQSGAHTIEVSYFQGPRDCLALVLAVAGADQTWNIFSTEKFKPPLNPQDWHDPDNSALTILPTTPGEASLTVSRLLQEIAKTEPQELILTKSDSARGCRRADPVRYCSN